MYYVIKLYLKHYRASRSRYKSRKVRRISSKIARFRSFFLFVWPLQIRVGPFFNISPLRYISTYYISVLEYVGPGIIAGGGSERHPTVRILEILERKCKFVTYLYAKVNSLVQAILSVYRVEFGIRLKVRLCTM